MPGSRKRFGRAERRARLERRAKRLARAKRRLQLRASVIALAMERGLDDLAADVAALVVKDRKRRTP